MRRMVGSEPRAAELPSSKRVIFDGAVRNALNDLVAGDRNHHPALTDLATVAEEVKTQSLWVPEGGISYDPDGTFRALAFGDLLLLGPNQGDIFRSARIKAHIFGRIVKDKAIVDDVEISKRPDGSVFLLP